MQPPPPPPAGVRRKCGVCRWRRVASCTFTFSLPSGLPSSTRYGARGMAENGNCSRMGMVTFDKTQANLRALGARGAAGVRRHGVTGAVIHGF